LCGGVRRDVGVVGRGDFIVSMKLVTVGGATSNLIAALFFSPAFFCHFASLQGLIFRLSLLPVTYRNQQTSSNKKREAGEPASLSGRDGRCARI